MSGLRRKPPTPLAGRTAVIAGAASGIGRALAMRLSSFGCPVAIADVDEPGPGDTESQLAGPTLARRLDVSDRGDHPGGVKTNIVRNGRMHDDPLGLDRTSEQCADDFEIDALTRITPTHYYRVLDSLHGLARRRGERGR